MRTGRPPKKRTCVRCGAPIPPLQGRQVHRERFACIACPPIATGDRTNRIGAHLLKRPTARLRPEFEDDPVVLMGWHLDDGWVLLR